MLECPSCHAVVPEGFRFCGQCGTALAVVACASCGGSNPSGQHYCGHCGAALGAPVGAGTADGAEAQVEERKLATVLFADVVGFTSLAERTDAEVVARMVDGAFRELGRVVTEHGGTVDKYMGDSLMAVFGVPAAHDDDAERAVAAALAMRRVGGDLVFSIGVNSGEVMATAVGGGDFTVIGDAVNVAARLEKAAGPGEVLCGRLTAELARHRVEFAERTPVLLKGKSEPVEVWEALRLRRAGGRVAGDAPPLVGRDDELAFLDMQWRRVRDDGTAKLVVLCGEAGSGKSRLLDELESIVCDGAAVVRAAYPGYGTFGGMEVAVELVGQLGHSADPDVERRVRSVLGELDDALAAMDPDSLHHEQVWALGRLLKERAEERPLVLVVDDLHWGDPETLGLVREVATRLRDVPILTVIAGRTDPGDWLAHFAAATTIRLLPLAPGHAAELATRLVGCPIAEEARQFLVDMANGNPLYLRELVSMAKTRNMLVDDGEEV
ncbi:MAG TPA: adenylate/guanylate cyclase domain-containing protein, partial [Acidimicrobiales bacterium]|nr:adenylate/guanylate cyclase domain-containing protein [Acidimicrobiales bacterium]